MMRIRPLPDRACRGAVVKSGADTLRPNEAKVKIRDISLLAIAFIAVQCVAAGSALAQTRGGAVTIHYAAVSPFIALLAGILILLIPRLLNYIVAVYLILVGLIGILGV
jgi:hypothetical protein